MNQSDEQKTMREEYDFSGGVRGKHHKLLVAMETDFPLFESVMALDEAIRAHFPRDVCGRTEWLDLMFTELAKLENGGYYCTPTNTLAFAWTGVDGEHFSFLVGEDGVSARSPVIFTAPMNYSDDMIDTNVVVAENFLKFVRLWLRFGACALGSMVWNPVRALAVYTSAEPPACTFDDAPNNQEQEILNFALDTLGLQPYIYTVAEFWVLQERYMPELQMSADFCEMQNTEKLWNLERARLKRSPDLAVE